MALGLSLLPQIQGFYRLLFLGFAERGHAMPLPSDSEAPKPWPWPRETAKAGLSTGLRVDVEEGPRSEPAVNPFGAWNMGNKFLP